MQKKKISLRCVGVNKATREMRQIRKKRETGLTALARDVKLTNCVTIREEGSQEDRHINESA